MLVYVCVCPGMASLFPSCGHSPDLRPRVSFKESCLIALEGPGRVIEGPCVWERGGTHMPLTRIPTSLQLLLEPWSGLRHNLWDLLKCRMKQPG